MGQFIRAHFLVDAFSVIALTEKSAKQTYRAIKIALNLRRLTPVRCVSENGTHLRNGNPPHQLPNIENRRMGVAPIINYCYHCSAMFRNKVERCWGKTNMKSTYTWRKCLKNVSSVARKFNQSSPVFSPLNARNWSGCRKRDNGRSCFDHSQITAGASKWNVHSQIRAGTRPPCAAHTTPAFLQFAAI